MARQKRVFRPSWKYVILGAAALFALVFGLVTAFAGGATMGRKDALVNDLATQAQIDQAKKDITAQYLDASAVNCVDPKTNRPTTATAVFQIAVNAYANRATVRACNQGDRLLAKLNGKWVATEVNINLNARANPAWARACYASDLLVFDTVVRPENNSIDASNLKMCQALQNGKILTAQDL